MSGNNIRNSVIKKKVLIVCTTDSMIWNFLIPHIKILEENGFTIECACSKTGFYIDELRQNHNLVVHEIPFSRSPLHTNNIIGLLKLTKLIKSKGYDIIHCHEPVGGVLGRLAGKKCGRTIYYTAHGFHFYKGAPKINWFLYYPVERWLAKYTDVLITINKEDYERAKKKFKAKNVVYVPGVGIDLNNATEIEISKSTKKKDLSIRHNAFLVLSVGELNKNKNHETIIRAIAKINNINIHYIICGQGLLESDLRNLSKELGVESQVHLLGFRKDIIEICKASDLFVFPSYREGLSVALMEAMASGLPVVCSNIRGNSDLIENGKGGFLIKASDVDGFQKAIEEMYYHANNRMRFGNYNSKKINNYSLENVIEQMKKIYLS